ncbi:LPXTG cell wall anchor domain-containing protein [Ruminococcus sp. AF25-3LB]|nr:LPXTG cell wall anchor domain-containing protein [Ruminococcus sp. AF25-3LB]RGG28600.1 LPXTG cell wall anchor domain-containing protein [Ruminococcus sp. AF25-17]
MKAGTYYLKEIEAPKGYNLLAKPIAVNLSIDTKGSGKITIYQDNKEVNKIKVENKSGTILPSTGGIGTTIFYIAGALLVLISGVVLIAKKRTDSK